jgi:hypothetical protein
MGGHRPKNKTKKIPGALFLLGVFSDANKKKLDSSRFPMIIKRYE